MSKISSKLKKSLAVMLSSAMVISALAVAPSNTAEAASKKVVKSLSGVSSSKSVTLGKSFTIKAKVTAIKKVAKDDLQVSVSASNKNVSFKISSKPKSKATSGTTSIKVTGKKAGTCKITIKTKATAKSNNKVLKKTMKVTIKPIQVTSIDASIDKSTIAVNESAQITAVAKPSNATDKKLKYSSSDTSVAIVSASGVVTGLKAGTTNITIKSSNGVKKTIKVTVTEVAVTDVKFENLEKEITVTGTTTLTATVLPENASNKTLVWDSSNKDVATVVDGVVTGLKVGTSDITATASNGVSAVCKVKVIPKNPLVEGLTIEVTNSYVDADGNDYANSVLMGKDATVRVRVVKDGEPVGNDSVTLSMNREYSYGTHFNDFEIRKATIETDENGYANFTVGLKSGITYNAVSGITQSVNVVAQESGSNAVNSLTIKFGSIVTKGITVLNNYDDERRDNMEYDYPAIVPSENANPEDSGIAESYYIDNSKVEQYVSSQQVSSFEDDHKVYLTAAPYLLMPATKETAHNGDWYYEVPEADRTSGPCSVYNDVSNTTTTVEVYDIPAGLQYMTLAFDKIDLSKYTVMNVELYDAKTGESLRYTDRVTGEEVGGKTINFQQNGSKGVQIRRQDDVSAKMVISLQSKGQVDTSSTGYVIKSIKGVWSTSDQELQTTEQIAGTVEWKNISEDILYESVVWSYDKAKEYLNNSKCKNFLNSSYKYSYMVPVFPYTGNALIVVKDSNDNPLANFLYPSINNGSNINTIAPWDPDIDPISASTNEIEDLVGNVTLDEKNPNIAIVDSEATGITGLMATVSVEGLNAIELNSQNGGVLYTSIQWAPVPNVAEVVENPDYFAIEGQEIVVKAQLYDKNGNLKTDPQKAITLSTDTDANVKLAYGTELGSAAQLTSVSNNGATNSDGQVILKFKGVTSDGTFSVIEGLAATCPNYIVKLSVVDGEYVDAADLYWADLGLSFIDTAEENAVETYQYENATKQIDDPAVYTVSDTTGWRIGYRVIAETTQFKYNRQLNEDQGKFLSVDGVVVEYSKNGSATLTQSDNVATLNSIIAGSTKLTGTITVPDTTAVVFHFIDKNGNERTEKNVGVGSIAAVNNTALALDTVWNRTGTKVETIYTEYVDVNSSTKAYIVVLDTYNNPIPNAKVAYTIVGVNESAEQVVYTNDKGVAAISLPVPTNYSANINTSAISVKVNDEVDTNFDIYYINTATQAMTLKDDILSVNSDLNKVTVYFSNAINKETLDKRQFKFVQDGATDVKYAVENIEVGEDDNSVIITLDKPIQNKTADHIVTIDTFTDDSGIDYIIIDKFGQKLVSSSVTFVPNDYVK